MKDDQRSTRRSWWTLARGGSIAMAGLAVVSLLATVIASHRALTDATDLIARGQGDVVITDIARELQQEDAQPPSVATLERVLKEHEVEGLRYLAIVDRDAQPIVEAGTAKMPAEPMRPGSARIEGSRARVTGVMGGPPRFGGGGGGFRRQGLGLVVAELEPPMIATLQRDLLRIGIVAAIASAALLAFAIAWSRSARRLEVLEQKAAREARLVALGGMSSVMAHELRNPLASLKGHAQLLAEDLATASGGSRPRAAGDLTLDDPADKKRKAKADRVVAEAVRLELLTSSLLDFVRDGPIERRAIAPAELVELALKDLTKDRVDVHLDGAPASITADPDRLARAIHNLVDNALKADESGRIDVAVKSNGDDVAFVVRDHGPGIPEADRARIFEPFVTTRVRGTGLGLAVARRIAEQHDGSLDVVTHADGGAVFTLSITA